MAPALWLALIYVNSVHLCVCDLKGGLRPAVEALLEGDEPEGSAP